MREFDEILMRWMEDGEDSPFSAFVRGILLIAVIFGIFYFFISL